MTPGKVLRYHSKMKVLHLPENIASQIQISVRALQRIGVEARGLLANRLLVGSPRVITSQEGMETCEEVFSDKRTWTPSWFMDRVRGTFKVLSAIQWADVVHYHFGDARVLPRDRDVRWLVWLDRLRLINFWGTDIRVAEIEFQDNPYFERAYKSIETLKRATPQRSSRIQGFYARNGFHCVIGSESMIAHIDRDLFPKYHLIRCSIDVGEMIPHYPDPDRRRPVIVHTPSNQLLKGTPSVLAAVERLRAKKIDFEFLLVQTDRKRALEILGQADIFLDQFILGGYGMASIEAMAMGKVTVCYIKPTVPYPDDLPIVNATVDNLTETLEELIANRELRNELGRKARAFAEKYHDATAMAHQQERLYRDLMHNATE